MLRRAAIATVVFAATLVAACGHQVTPEPLTNNLSGEVVVRITTSGPLDFNNFTYAIAIDTCGPGVPYPQAAFTGYTSYSYVFFIGGFAGVALPELYEYYFKSGNITTLPVQNLNPSTTQFVPNYNGQGTELQFTFFRADLANPLNIAQPCPNIAPTPGSTPNPQSTALSLSTWTFNIIVFDKNKVPQDSLGQYGATDNTYPGIVVDTTTNVQLPYFRPTPIGGIPSNPSAQLTFAEVDNYL